MTPGARVAAAIDVLDQILSGNAAEKALTNWARGARYAGSGDRSAVRDHVFDALRRKRSAAWIGGAETGRGLMIGICRLHGLSLETVFSGVGHAPPAITDQERASRSLSTAPLAVQLDLPDWIFPDLEHSLGPEFADVAALLQTRAPVFLRVNQLKANRDEVIAILRAEDILAEPHPVADTALRVVHNARRLRNSTAYQDGLIELQDASSQAVVAALPPSKRVLDFCAGGGGKSLALAAKGATVFAHDADPRRMVDIPSRAQRAGTPIPCLNRSEIEHQAPFDLVLCDVPCSGSGAWRRSPDGKWRLTRQDLDRLLRIQSAILDEVIPYGSEHGAVAYVTCSFLQSENRDQIDDALVRHPGWVLERDRQFSPVDGGDGFYLAVIRRKTPEA